MERMSEDGREGVGGRGERNGGRVLKNDTPSQHRQEGCEVVS